MSLKRVALKGFRSIREVDLELKPINLLIGANGSGKSNFLGAFRFMRELAQRNLQFHVGQRGGANKILHFGRKFTRSLEISLEFSDCRYGASLGATDNDRLQFSYELIAEQLGPPPDGEQIKEMAGSSRAESLLPLDHQHPAGQLILARINGWRVYHFHDTSPEARVKQTTRTDQTDSLYSDASNLAAFLSRLKSTNAYERILRTIQRVAPFLRDFVLDPEDEQGKFIRLRWSHRGSEEVFDVADLSDGTLRFICLTTLLLQPKLPDVIILDEPELGLHPAALNILAAMMQSVSAHTQIIASTQSVTLANQFGIDDIVVVERKDEASVFRRLEADALKDWLDEYSVGDLWEKNVIGGNP